MGMVLFLASIGVMVLALVAVLVRDFVSRHRYREPFLIELSAYSRSARHRRRVGRDRRHDGPDPRAVRRPPDATFERPGPRRLHPVVKYPESAHEEKPDCDGGCDGKPSRAPRVHLGNTVNYVRVSALRSIYYLDPGNRFRISSHRIVNCISANRLPTRR